MSSNQKNKPSRENKVRIIGGKWRGQKLNIADVEGLRPTGDRLRETLFNWLTMNIHGAHCLDAFAGTGALGFEALSRGASSTQFIEQNATAANQIVENISKLKADAAKLYRGSFLGWQTQTPTPFDLIFLDPPFAGNLWQASIEHITSNVPVAKEAQLYIEAPQDQRIDIPAHWSLIKSKKIGQISASIYLLN